MSFFGAHKVEVFTVDYGEFTSTFKWEWTKSEPWAPIPDRMFVLDALGKWQRYKTGLEHRPGALNLHKRVA